MAIKISELANLTAYSDSTLMAVVDTTGPFATVKTTVGGLKTYVLGNITSTLGNLEANAAVQSGQITTANIAMKGYVDGQISTLTSNAAVQAGALATLTSNAAVQAGDIATLFANAAVQAGALATLTSNAAVQAGDIASTNTAITTANTAMKGYVDAVTTAWTANAGAQAGSIATLTSNAAVQAGDIATLFSNAAVQAGALATLTSNAAVQSGVISILNAPGSSGNILVSNGTSWISGRPHLVQVTAVATTTGANIDISNIPADAKRVTITFSGVSTANINPVIVQLGTVTSFENTGYTGAVSGILGNVASAAYSVGFQVDANTALLAAAGTRNGIVTLVNVTGNTWVSQSTLGYTGTAGTTMGGGSKALGGVLTRVRITTTIGSDAFDAGTLGVIYE